MAESRNPKKFSIKRVLILLGGIFGGIYGFLIITSIIGGPGYNPVLDLFGAKIVREKGVFINCSKSENRDNDFCHAARERAQNARTGGAILRNLDPYSKPFTLHN